MGYCSPNKITSDTHIFLLVLKLIRVSVNIQVAVTAVRLSPRHGANLTFHVRSVSEDVVTKKNLATAEIARDA